MNFGSDLPSTMRNSTPSVGELGEQIVAEWLQARNWVILHHRWRCRWGEIDLIAQQPGNNTEVIETTDREKEQESIKIQEIPHRHSPPHSVTSSPPDTELRSKIVVETDTETRGRGDGEKMNLLRMNATGYDITTSLTASPVLAFIEVKTRSPRNWDADGLLAITPQKQAKLWQAAQLFLAQSPALANFPCRFDVALVNCQRVSQRSNPEHPDIFSSSSEAMGKAIPSSSIQLGQPLFRAGYRLILQDYIPSAFD